MIIYNTLNQTKLHLEESGILTLGPSREDYEVQLTSDDRPFAYSGMNIVTIYPTSLIREDLKQSKKYYFNFNVTVTVRTKYTSHDREYLPLYQRAVSSLSTISELITYLLDGNNTLLSNISTAVNTQISAINTYIDALPTDSSGIKEKFTTSMGSAQIISPIWVESVDATPIPRYADFFTALNTKDFSNSIDSGIQPSGWSMTVRVRGPNFIAPILC